MATATMRSFMIVFSAIIATLTNGQNHQQRTNANNNGPIYFPNDDLNNNVRFTAFNQRAQSQGGSIGFPARPVPSMVQPAMTPLMSTFYPATNGFQATPLWTSTPQENDDIVDFSWRLFQGSKTANPITNLVISPLLLQTTLSLLQSAADGSTREQLAQVTNNVSPQRLDKMVRSVQQTQSPNDLGLAAAVFTDKQVPLNLTFVGNARGRNVAVIPVNFGNAIDAGYTINNWIANATANHIRNIFKPENSRGLRVLLANALYFRGFWEQVFNTTERDRFYTTERLDKFVTYMKKVEMLRASQFECDSGARGIWVEIPYKGNEFSMVVILPAIRHTLEEFVRQMSTKDITDIMEQLSYGYRRLVHLKMPKFSVQSSFSLVNVLLKMGLVDAFTINSQLPFMTDTHANIKIDDILQEAVLSVDEAGTVAAVAQTVGVVTLSLVDTPDEVVVTLDQPFLAIIVDRRNAIPLVMAKIFDP